MAEPRQHIRLWSNQPCHCEERSDVTIALPSSSDNVAITTQTASARNDKKAAFTLAEVLITLAIIGVVAALTIPTLVANYQNKSWNTASEVFERKLEEALRVMNTQQTLAGYNTTEDFVNELSNHFKISKICKNDDLMSCFEDEVNWSVIDITNNTNSDNYIDISNLKTAAHLGQNDWGTDAVGVQFANGTTGLIAYNPDCKQDPYSNQITGTSCLALLYDTSGFKSPNTLGKDLRSINANLSDCAFKAENVCFTAPFIPVPLTKAECEEIADQGFGNKKEWCGGYPDDYWAGAVKACGGVDKMPTLDQAAKIADYIYGISGTGGKQNITSGITMDRNKVSELGFTLNSQNSDSFYVWSGEDASKGRAYARCFTSTTTYFYHEYRNYNYFQAVCLDD